MKYLTLIRTIALLHQWQRPRQDGRSIEAATVEYIEVTLDDIAVANRLAHEVLGRSLDELPPQTRRLLLLVDAMVTAECERQKMERADYRFSRRDVREVDGLGRYAVENPSAPAGGAGVSAGPSRRARPELRL